MTNRADRNRMSVDRYQAVISRSGGSGERRRPVRRFGSLPKTAAYSGRAAEWEFRSNGLKVGHS